MTNSRLNIISKAMSSLFLLSSIVFGQILNGNFSEGLKSWSLFVPAESKDKGCAMEEGPGKEGKGARMKSSAPARWALSNPPIPVTVGEKWKLTFWVKDEKTTVKPGTPGFTARLTMADAKGKSTDQHLYVLPGNKVLLAKNYGTYKAAHALPSEWTKIEGIFEIYEGNATMSLNIMPSGIEGSFLIDEVVLEKVASTTTLSPIVDK